ncbi:unnamed protein product [Linum trigynum]|uniref:Uncharacterized protein n=1 Tax=Linum trigynum TaxID=586398 RepID=A0AAV2GRK2_9ROSI
MLASTKWLKLSTSTTTRRRKNFHRPHHHRVEGEADLWVPTISNLYEADEVEVEERDHQFKLVELLTLVTMRITMRRKSIPIIGMMI